MTLVKSTKPNLSATDDSVLTRAKLDSPFKPDNVAEGSPREFSVALGNLVNSFTRGEILSLSQPIMSLFRLRMIKVTSSVPHPVMFKTVFYRLMTAPILQRISRERLNLTVLYQFISR
jgi:hypothetical protein